MPIGRRWYLVAYDLTRNDWRSFRLDRVDEVAATGARFRPRTEPTDAQVVETIEAELVGLAGSP